jgi:hypothetical protein
MFGLLGFAVTPQGTVRVAAADRAAVSLDEFVGEKADV